MSRYNLERTLVTLLFLAAIGALGIFAGELLKSPGPWLAILPLSVAILVVMTMQRMWQNE